jgi:hypothetical protein
MRSLAVNDTRNPFPGFQPYNRADRDRLFGRDEDLALLRSRLLSGRTTLLFAGSGVGKTSFLNAKVIPELQEYYFPIYHNRWLAEEAPLTAVVTAVTTAAGGEPGAEGGSLLKALQREAELPFLLILDQFEEVFQYYRDTRPLALLVEELARVIGARDVDVRVVLSMREEFLGDLSAFDDPLPDLFNNYYRLKNPHWRVAGQIVRRTANPALCEERGLGLLLDDLRAIRTGVIQVEAAESLRSHVAPPYLQIVCHRIWEREQPVRNGVPFLSSYKAGNAWEELKQFIEEKLKLGILSEPQRKRAAEAFDHLIAARGAKKAFTVKQLTGLIHLKSYQVTQLADTLQILTEARVGILRCFEAQGVSWFELHHDMYAPMLKTWCEKIRSELSPYDLEAEIDDVGEWELAKYPLDAFWVYLPHFLANPSPNNQFFKTMLSNFEHKGTEYVYILQTKDDLLRLSRLMKSFDQEIAKNGSAGMISAWKLVKVVVLGVSGPDERAKVLSRLLHLNNCWIANPDSNDPNDLAGFDVVWDNDGKTIRGGRRLPLGKVRQIIRALKALFEFYPPQALEAFRDEEDLEGVLRSSPISQLRVIDPAGERPR